MGFGSAYWACGCRQTSIMGSEPRIWIDWIRCSEHYKPEQDDKMILEAAKNKREMEKELRQTESITFPHSEGQS